MQRLLAVLAVLTTHLPAFAEDRPSLATAIAAVRAEGHVFEVGNGHYLAIAAGTTPGEDRGWIAMFYGTAQTLYRMQSSDNAPQIASSDDGWAVGTTPDRSTDVDIVDARYEQPSLQLLATRVVVVRCGKRSFTAKELVTGRELLRKAKLQPQLHHGRLPLRLARDEGTTYYYVDVEANDNTARSPHLYIGKRGAMKPMKLVDYATDSAGQVLVTKAGTMHIDHVDELGNKVRMSWTAPGKAPAPLREVVTKRELVFGDLGVYDGQRWDTPCDDLPLR